jgi:hypothetical protein
LPGSGRVNQYILAPEQLAAIRKLDYQARYNIYKASLFVFGTIAVEMITLDSTQFCYNESRMEISSLQLGYTAVAFHAPFLTPSRRASRVTLPTAPSLRFISCF